MTKEQIQNLEDIGPGICDACDQHREHLRPFDHAPFAGGAICDNCLADPADDEEPVRVPTLADRLARSREAREQSAAAARRYPASFDDVPPGCDANYGAGFDGMFVD